MYKLFEAIIADLIGRPILWLIKWLRWPLLFWGFYFNSISTYDPTTKHTSNHFTILPFLVGIALFGVGMRVKRYDEAERLSMRLLENLDSRGITNIFPDRREINR